MMLLIVVLENSAEPENDMNSNSDKPTPLEITGDSKPDVPTFTCIVYVRKNDDETAGPSVFGRVANLDGIEASGDSERFVLSKVTREFKSRVLKMFEDGQEIPWIDPPVPRNENERVRSIPMHL